VIAEYTLGIILFGIALGYTLSAVEDWRRKR
jgi:hypothetical protein